MFVEGAYYETERSLTGNKPRRWIVLPDPNPDGRAIVVSFTSPLAFEVNPDIWVGDMALTTLDRLDRDSTIHVGYAKLWTEADIDSYGGGYKDRVNDDVLARARCNVCDLKEHLDPPVRAEFSKHEGVWCPDC